VVILAPAEEHCFTSTGNLKTLTSVYISTYKHKILNYLCSFIQKLESGSVVLVFNYHTNNPVSKFFTFKFSFLYESYTFIASMLCHCKLTVSIL